MIKRIGPLCELWEKSLEEDNMNFYSAKILFLITRGYLRKITLKIGVGVN